MRVNMNTTTLAPSSATNEGTSVASSPSIASTLSLAQKLAQLREETKAAEAQLAAQEAFIAQQEAAAKAAAEASRTAELASLPERFGFGTGPSAMRSFCGFLGYHFLRGATPKAKVKAVTKAAPKASAKRVVRTKSTGPLAPEKVERLLTLIKGGLPVRKACREVGCSSQTGYSHMKRAGVALPTSLIAA